jgi:hypothetical protein
VEPLSPLLSGILLTDLDREREILALGLDAERAWPSAMKGRSPWWNAGAHDMIHSVHVAYITRWGRSPCCASNSDSSALIEPPDAEPHVQWCVREVRVSLPPTR